MEGFDLVDWGARFIKTGRTLQELYIILDRLMHRLVKEKQPHVLVMERNNFSVASHNARLAAITNRIRTLARKHGIKLVEYGPRTIRKVVCGDGNASKSEIARTVAMRHPELKLYLKSDRGYKEQFFQNMFDAVACGLTWLILNGDSTKCRGNRDRQEQ